jgi:pyrroloquinoline quinone biosynthesis protein B
MHLGREVVGAKNVRVYVLPRMRQFLETNGPWSQLVSLHNIELTGITAAAPPYHGIKLADGLAVAAFTVPHRDEYSETAGFRIEMNSEEFFFIPDINKWERWDTDIRDIVAHATAVLIDGTFYADGELPGRSMGEVPHPFVTETMALFGESTIKRLPPGVTEKIWFIHLNHTNPLLWDKDKQDEVRSKGFNIAFQGQKM